MIKGVLIICDDIDAKIGLRIGDESTLEIKYLVTGIQTGRDWPPSRYYMTQYSATQHSRRKSVFSPPDLQMINLLNTKSLSDFKT